MSTCWVSMRQACVKRGKFYAIRHGSFRVENQEDAENLSWKGLMGKETRELGAGKATADPSTSVAAATFARDDSAKLWFVLLHPSEAWMEYPAVYRDRTERFLNILASWHRVAVRAARGLTSSQAALFPRSLWSLLFNSGRRGGAALAGRRSSPRWSCRPVNCLSRSNCRYHPGRCLPDAAKACSALWCQ
jgi:hypothetical protein